MHNLRLKWFLYFLSVKLAYRNRTSSAFQRVIADRELVVQILTQDHSLNRYFCFSAGRVTSAIGEHCAPNLVLAFADVRHASQILRCCLSDMPLLMQHMNKGALTVQGDIGVLIWFSALCEWITDNSHAVTPHYSN